MGLGGVLFAGVAAQAVSQIGQGYAQKSEADFNSTLLQGKANLIDQQEQIQEGQYQRQKGQVLSTSIADTAKNGLLPQGSVMAVMNESQTQIGIDQAISKFNLEQQKNYTTAQAAAYTRAGTQAVNTGYSNAFSTMLNGASNYAMYKYRPSNTTFDSNTKAPARASEGVLG